MTSAREFSRRLPLSGSSQELDALTGTFNEMMTSLVAAEGETEAAYVAAIKALAAALDARDPYTSGPLRARERAGGHGGPAHDARRR